MTKQRDDTTPSVRRRSARTGRFVLARQGGAARFWPQRPDDEVSIVSETERRAAARARVTVDRRRGIKTEQWILDLAQAPDATAPR